MHWKLHATDDDIQAALKSIDLDGNGTMNLGEYYANQKDRSSHNPLHCSLIRRSGIRKEFKRFNSDNNSYITEQELCDVIHARGAKFPDNQIDMVLQDTDKNNDWKIDFEEFVLLMTKWMYSVS